MDVVGTISSAVTSEVKYRFLAWYLDDNNYAEIFVEWQQWDRSFEIRSIQVRTVTNGVERKEIMSKFYKEMDIHKDGADTLGMLLTEIYREKSKLNKAEIQRVYDNHQLTSAQFEDIVKKLEEQNQHAGSQPDNSSEEEMERD